MIMTSDAYIPDHRTIAAMRSIRDDGPATMHGLLCRGVKIKSKVLRAAQRHGMLRYTRRGWDLTREGTDALREHEHE